VEHQSRSLARGAEPRQLRSVVWVRGVQVLEWATGEEWFEANLRDEHASWSSRAAAPGPPPRRQPPTTRFESTPLAYKASFLCSSLSRPPPWCSNTARREKRETRVSPVTGRFVRAAPLSLPSCRPWSGRWRAWRSAGACQTRWPLCSSGVRARGPHGAAEGVLERMGRRRGGPTRAASRRGGIGRGTCRRQGHAAGADPGGESV